ncbi:MAG: cytochrome c5 family protein [Proteobacteria bacterium]|nr:cytochrome c5 family protein [Pseudomonadota bacterium]
MSQRDTSSIRNLLIGIVIFIGIILPIASIINKLVTAEFKLHEHESQVPNTEHVEKVVLISKPESKIIPITINNEDLIIANKLGKEIYDKACTSCHTNGLAGAPKFADKNSWVERIIKGEDTLVNNAMTGINVMPPRGGRSDLSDEEVKSAVQYMLAAVSNATVVTEPAKPVVITQPVIESIVKPAEPIQLSNTPKSGKDVIATPSQIIKPSETVNMPDKDIATPSQITKPSETVNMTGDAKMSGKEVYDTSCSSCHRVGIAKAPIFGNKIDWESRITKPESALISSVINGFNIMPPRGGNNHLNDAEIKLAVQYMVQAAK